MTVDRHNSRNLYKTELTIMPLHLIPKINKKFRRKSVTSPLLLEDSSDSSSDHDSIVLPEPKRLLNTQKRKEAAVNCGLVWFGRERNERQQQLKRDKKEFTRTVKQEAISRFVSTDKENNRRPTKKTKKNVSPLEATKTKSKTQQEASNKTKRKMPPKEIQIQEAKKKKLPTPPRKTYTSPKYCNRPALSVGSGSTQTSRRSNGTEYSLMSVATRFPEEATFEEKMHVRGTLIKPYASHHLPCYIMLYGVIVFDSFR